MGRDRTVTEDSFQSTSYMVLTDEENVMNLQPVSASGSIVINEMGDPYCAPLLDEQDHAHLDDEEDYEFARRRAPDDDELTPFLFSTEPTQLNGLNFLNIVTYMLHLFVSWGIGMWGLDGLIETRVDILAKSGETLMTPAKWCYWIWVPILVSETVFALAQLHPDYRARPIVQSGTAFFFFYTSVGMTVWTLCFAFHQFLWSFVSVTITLASLAALLLSQQKVSTYSSTTHNNISSQQHRQRWMEEYYLFRLPFLLHFGWMVVMGAAHFALLVKHLAGSNSAPLQLSANVLALALLLPVATTFLFQSQEQHRNHVIPAVIVWAYFGIAWRLHRLAPTDDLWQLYGEEAVLAFEMAAWGLGGLTAALLLPSVLVWVTQEYCTIRVVQLQNELDDSVR